MSIHVGVSGIVSHASEPRIKSEFERMIASRICVDRPYNQLTDLVPWERDGIAAHVLFESPPGVEVGALASAEIGRHLAILGSCALARNNAVERKHYYLATEAILVRHVEPNVRRDGPLRLTARPDGKNIAQTELYSPEGRAIASLRCRYQVLSDRVFARFFGAHRTESRVPARESPYAAPTNLARLVSGSECATALLEEVRPEMCVGHFNEYPAMPVAILMDGLNRLSCEHIKETTHPHMRLVTCTVGADTLAFAGEAVEFTVAPIDRDGDLVHYEGFARRAGDSNTVFGRAAFAYQLLDEGSRPTKESEGSILRHLEALRARDSKLWRD